MTMLQTSHCNDAPHLLVVISSHGYGHAMPTTAVLNSLCSLLPEVRITIASDVPRLILAQRFEGEFELIKQSTEFGIGMASPLDILIEESAEGYADLIRRWDDLVNGEAELTDAVNPDLVLSNISFLAIAGAKRINRPSLAMCSFTWASVYACYCRNSPEAQETLSRLWLAYNAADVFIHVGPIGTPSTDRSNEVRRHLGIGPTKWLVVSDFGGIQSNSLCVTLPQFSGVHCLVAGESPPEREDISCINSLGLSHIDAIASADVIVTKPGYGTCVESCCSEASVLVVEHGRWPEEPYLFSWLAEHGRCARIDRVSWNSGNYESELMALCERTVPTSPVPTQRHPYPPATTKPPRYC